MEKMDKVFKQMQPLINALRKLNAHQMMREESYEKACEMYPDDIEFLTEHKDKTYQEVKEILIKQEENDTRNKSKARNKNS